MLWTVASSRRLYFLYVSSFLLSLSLQFPYSLLVRRGGRGGLQIHPFSVQVRRATPIPHHHHLHLLSVRRGGAVDCRSTLSVRLRRSTPITPTPKHTHTHLTRWCIGCTPCAPCREVVGSNPSHVFRCRLLWLLTHSPPKTSKKPIKLMMSSKGTYLCSLPAGDPSIEPSRCGCKRQTRLHWCGSLAVLDRERQNTIFGLPTFLRRHRPLPLAPVDRLAFLVGVAKASR